MTSSLMKFVLIWFNLFYLVSICLFNYILIHKCAQTWSWQLSTPWGPKICSQPSIFYEHSEKRNKNSHVHEKLFVLWASTTLVTMRPPSPLNSVWKKTVPSALKLLSEFYGVTLTPDEGDKKAMSSSPLHRRYVCNPQMLKLKGHCSLLPTLAWELFHHHY